MSDHFTITWIDKGQPPRVASDPSHPDGVHIDSGRRPACRVELPYMTQTNIGLWLVQCDKCRTNMMITMASRPDDPVSVMLPCKINQTPTGKTKQ
jgi:hypothetical protein